VDALTSSEPPRDMNCPRCNLSREMRSCDELAQMRDSVSDDGDGTTQTEVIGALCTEVSITGFCE
jgi:hypothetical protein